jgi:cytochrome b561
MKQNHFAYPQYHPLMQLLHWFMAAAVIIVLTLGLMETQFFIHKSLAVTVCFLVVLRVFVREKHPAPPLPAAMTSVQVKLAHLGHFLLYFMMFVMPIQGLLMINSSGKAPSFWGLFALPMLVDKNRPLHHFLGEMHELGGYVFLALIILHVLATIQHQFILKDGLLWRMLPKSGAKSAHN